MRCENGSDVERNDNWYVKTFHQILLLTDLIQQITIVNEQCTAENKSSAQELTMYGTRQSCIFSLATTLHYE